MLFYLFLLLIVLPLAEVMILVRIGQATSLWVPIAIVIVTGIVGTALARWQGWKVLDRIRDDVRAGNMPADALMDGFLVLVAGILFVLPGVLTDLVGIALLFPPSRALVKRGMRAWIKRNVELHMGRISGNSWPSSTHSTRVEHDRIIDARVTGTRVEDAKNTG